MRLLERFFPFRSFFLPELFVVVRAHQSAKAPLAGSNRLDSCGDKKRKKRPTNMLEHKCDDWVEAHRAPGRG